MTKMNIDQAWSIWTAPLADADHTEETRREQAESHILDQKPKTPAQAAMMLEVLQENLQAGSRSDNRDLGALARLTAFMRRLERTVAEGAGR
jgi:hypothetical protein